MALQIEDGTGKGYRAGVTIENQLMTQAEIHELQHHISRTKGQVYQAIGTHTFSSSGTKILLHIKNNDPARLMVVSYMRIQFPDSTAVVSTTFFDCGFNTLYSSNGIIITPVNMNASSGNVATVIAYDDNPTVSGAFTEFDRWYPDESMQTFNKHGSLILGLGDTIAWRLTTDQTSGFAYCRVTLMMLDKANE